MAACLILGDSIALGIAAALGALQARACDIRAQAGVSVPRIAAMVPTTSYQWVLISAGSNNSADAHIYARLVQLRMAIRAKHVIWIYPRSSPPAWAVHHVAQRHGDRAVNVSRLRSRDGVHPASYRAVVRLIFDGHTVSSQ